MTVDTVAHVAQITAVTLRRGGCYGQCPIYDVTLRRNGKATWHGEMFTDRIGDYRGEVDEYAFRPLAGFIERCGFFDWRDEYSIEVTDNPTYELEVTRNRTKKTVSQYGTDEPLDFWVIAALIDGIAGRMAWKPKTT